ncbi:hypothetical protein [Limosilactobacillus reuteri]|uniref:hypothetical protein n=1 Tax=Limosilactobacillus reuteri TaxID=1598 RepID=UPI00128CEB58|nr:hypothetical protein [Limosilactobacillus reuteri]MBM6812972.1 hypothetical protein [Limosilactobacillus reuteri]MQB69404.1 hypothetical protein [Limosilactobacillus reuteri]MQC01509.1 hypothetical protein [Limosilactobacillus reuteri]MQC04751.1 hypothetical protein [Limosilactobacillus reuteri]
MYIDRKALEDILKENPNGFAAIEEFQNKNSDFQQHANKYNIARRFYADPSDNKRVYHYTKLDNLNEILSSGMFYMGSINDMNDPMEVKYTYELAVKVLKSIGAENHEISVFQKDYRVDFFDTYLWSFSYSDYNQALQNYGDIALGFDTQQIQTALANRYTKPYFQNMQVGNAYVFSLKVEYNLDIQKNYITSVMSEWLRAYRGLRYPKTLPIANAIRLECLQALFLFSLCFKRYKYHQEEEIRFVLEKLTKDNKSQSDLLFNGYPKSIAKITSNMLKEIVVTHTNGADKKLKMIRAILDKNGFKKTGVRMTDLDY